MEAILVVPSAVVKRGMSTLLDPMPTLPRTMIYEPARL
jgi:hypothetical protein